eukprot:CAMPEP_0172533206 /NCGR_PEP_ID=MMETSP1067-20121228/5997_1 /TAXON_ID=265564 ORGANISM="Thalassiosira punctigera, Strain Tpunct2005C2" /NCGR_SAMPLE_ID=MMETSP1067 /ASSEMBLY_ACC=CAM_ASM_000444 /LENGTH=239 /DNA_ID=CAMNT_0013317821 /DNA_START=57 /DNA_END=776 /DNA_ORIENTATION=+
MDNVTLNIYDLLPESQPQQQSSSSSSQPSASANFFRSLLPSLGFGAYHTSIDVRGFRYQFGANMGIVRTSSPGVGGETAHSLRAMPNCTYRESIILGQTWCDQSEINATIQRMREDKFTGDNYHLANRNCNHFSETFAMALILGSDLLEDSGAEKKLDRYPPWVNRLARAGTVLLSDDTVCNVLAEARVAAGLKGKVGWTLSSLDNNTKKSTSAAKGSQKKELTEKQKAALAKLKKSSK